MKIVLILTLVCVSFSTVTVDITFNDACTSQIATVTGTDSVSAPVNYGHFMADCPSTVASPADDSAFGCDYYAQIYRMFDNT